MLCLEQQRSEVKSVVLTAGPTVRAVAKVLHVPLGHESRALKVYNG